MLTLIVVPVIYSSFDSLKAFVSRHRPERLRFPRRKRKREAGESFEGKPASTGTGVRAEPA